MKQNDCFVLIHKLIQVSEFDGIRESLVIPTLVYNNEVFFNFPKLLSSAMNMLFSKLLLISILSYPDEACSKALM